jgi:hypothetical protein
VTLLLLHFWLHLLLRLPMMTQVLLHSIAAAAAESGRPAAAAVLLVVHALPVISSLPAAAASA